MRHDARSYPYEPIAAKSGGCCAASSHASLPILAQLYLPFNILTYQSLNISLFFTSVASR
jgi:hypothetical protein